MPSGVTFRKPLVIGSNNKPEALQSGEYIRPIHVRIPQLIVRVGRIDPALKSTPVSVMASPQFDKTYKEFNPQIWFFKLRRKGRRRQYDNDILDNRTRKVSEKWVHPTDIARGGKMGIPTGYAYWGESLYTHHTEWPFTAVRHTYQLLSTFDAFEYFSYAGSRLTMGDLPGEFAKISPSGVAGGRKKKARTVWGYFCIVIDDYNDPDFASTKSKIFGPPSQVFSIRPRVHNGQVQALQIMLTTHSVKRNR